MDKNSGSCCCSHLGNNGCDREEVLREHGSEPAQHLGVCRIEAHLRREGAAQHACSEGQFVGAPPTPPQHLGVRRIEAHLSTAWGQG